MQFVETFLQCEGKIKAVEEKLGISYPTVRSRLRDVIVAMGCDVSPEDEEAAAQTEELRRQVLEDLEAGKISTEDAIARLHGGA